MNWLREIIAVGLGAGLGVEDIQVWMRADNKQVSLELIRREVQRMREDGTLRRIYARR